MVETEICGHRVGYNMLVSDARPPRSPVAATSVTTGDVVALQVAECDHGTAIELDPREGAGTVVQAVHDARGRDVALVVRPVLGKTLRIYATGSARRSLLATVRVQER